ncbi:hypothetical protein N0V83_004568 [Neocucurbitaria cava]|uniref:Uncharacterized protein n=1 Tax=Neocucurbitaria cava TaxID=798079 RepID=A0A9W8Y9W5_9PLEO|nr:hypothetical protein N0V83_004568 [Neocucurbitaria cava]
MPAQSGAPISLADRNEDQNNILVETLRDLVKSIDISHEFYNPDAPRPTLSTAGYDIPEDADFDLSLEAGGPYELAIDTEELLMAINNEDEKDDVHPEANPSINRGNANVAAVSIETLRERCRTARSRVKVLGLSGHKKVVTLNDHLLDRFLHDKLSNTEKFELNADPLSVFLDMVNGNIDTDIDAEFDTKEGIAMLVYMSRQGEIDWDEATQMVSQPQVLR